MDISFPIEANSIVSELQSLLFTEKGIRFFVKREDLMHPQISGNKWRKLKYNLLEAKRLNHHTLLTFGGSFSNHIYATAAAGRLYGFKTIGIIRGELVEPLNTTLQFAVDHGMILKYVNREMYRNKDEADFIESLKSEFGDFYLIPEGGTNQFAIHGCKEILQPADFETYSHICCCCGTGGTITGIIAASKGKSQILGYSVLKGDFMENEIKKLIGKSPTLTKKYFCCTESKREGTDETYSNFNIINNYHFGGYAKNTSELMQFIEMFENQFNIPLEHVYTGKLFHGIFDMIAKDYFPKGAKILAIHTGGLR